MARPKGSESTRSAPSMRAAAPGAPVASTTKSAGQRPPPWAPSTPTTVPSSARAGMTSVSHTISAPAASAASTRCLSSARRGHTAPWGPNRLLAGHDSSRPCVSRDHAQPVDAMGAVEVYAELVESGHGPRGEPVARTPCHGRARPSRKQSPGHRPGRPVWPWPRRPARPRSRPCRVESASWRRSEPRRLCPPASGRGGRGRDGRDGRDHGRGRGGRGRGRGYGRGCGRRRGCD